MKLHYIQKLIAQGEHQHLDFKFEIADPRKIAKSFVAFANASGGKLLIGVNDNGTIAGIKSGEEKFMADSAAKIYTKPPVIYKLKEWNIGGKKVLEIVIPEGESKPYFAQDENGKLAAYVRSGDKNILANRILINAWKRKSRPEGVYIHYSESEKLLLKFLELNCSISVEKFKEIALVSRQKAENILSNFIALDIIEPVISEDKVVYQLVSDGS